LVQTGCKIVPILLTDPFLFDILQSGSADWREPDAIRTVQTARVTLLGGAASEWPLVAWAHQAAMPVIGFLHSGSPDPFTHMVAAFRQGLKEEGYIDGQNDTRRT
jgi:hypothetical protein